MYLLCCSFFFFNDTATTEIYTLSLHDALPICRGGRARRDGRDGRFRGPPAGRAERGAGRRRVVRAEVPRAPHGLRARARRDRKSTRLNSSHANISYAVFCLKKKAESTPRSRGA